MPTPPALGLRHPASYAVDDDTVLDEVTGLMWQRGHSEPVTPAAAVDYCANLDLAGHCNWRVPSRIELVSLMYLEADPPLADVLEDAIYSLNAWGSENNLWAASLDGFFVQSSVGEGDEFPFGVRCVRVDSAPAVSERTLSIQGEGNERVVVDSGTGLIWKYEDSVVELPQAQAQTYCQNITAACGGFRLASIKELLSILDDAHPSTEYLDPAYFPFPEPPENSFTFAWPQDAGWVVNFGLRASYTLAGQLSIRREDEGLVFCVK